MTARYCYTAVSSSGQTCAGISEASSKAELVDRLLAEDLYLLHARRKPAVSARWLRRGPELALLERLASTMALLLRADLPLVDSLEVVVATADRRLAGLARLLLERLRGGQTLSQAIAAEPALFGRLYPALFSLGEKSGEMQCAFEQMRSSLHWQRQLQLRLRSVLSYPLLALLLMSAVFVFLLLVVVPQLADFVRSNQQQLPWHTRALFSVSHTMQHYGAVLLALVPGIVVPAAVFVRCTGSPGILSSRLLLRIPLSGPLLLRVKLARFFHSMSLLLRSGIDLLGALETSAATLRSTVLEAAVADVSRRVRAGSLLADAVSETGAFPDLVSRLMRVGELSGELPDILEHLSAMYDSELRVQMRAIEQYLPPLLILLVGMILLWMIVSIMGPLYESVIDAGSGLL